VFLLIELSLRIAGYGFPATAAIKSKVNGKTCYCDNIKFGWGFFPRNIAREFEPFIFPVDKPDGTYRIFIFGASAAMGTPDQSFCFGRFLRTMLRQRYPEANFEVITAAMAAINSHVVYQVAKDCARYDPDLFIVYLGNNEVTGPYGAGTVFAPLSDNLSAIRIGIGLKRTRLGQLLTNLLGSIGSRKEGPQFWAGMGMFLEKQIQADDPGLESVYRHFQRNLEDIRRVGRNGGAKVILCTVGSSLKDCPPFASLHRPDLTDAQKDKWDAAYRQAVELETAGDYAEALEHYLSAAEIDDRYADLQFRLGRCYWTMGEYDKARDRYIQARELDTLRFRADSRINQIIRDVANPDAAKGVYLVDVVKEFEENSPHATAGGELFYEHVHLNFGGTYLLAKTVLEQVEQILPDWVRGKKEGQGALPTEAECAQRLAYTDWDRYKIAGEVLHNFIKKPPFTNQLYHDERVRLMEQKFEELKASLDPEALKKCSTEHRHAIENDSDDWRLHWKYGKLLAENLKDYEAAAKEYRFVQALLPHSHLGYAALGSVLRGQGDLDAAIAEYEKAIRINPTRLDAHYYLAQAYQRQGKMEHAKQYYSKTIRLRPGAVGAYNKLVEILYQEGEIDEAVDVCRRGLRMAPKNAVLRCNLGVLLEAQGHRDEAIKQLRSALEMDPNSARIRSALEAVLSRAY